MTIERNISLFIIEDNMLYSAALQQFLQTEFSKSGFSVSIRPFKNAESCIDYLDCYRSEMPDIIILDYFLNAHYSYAMNGLNALFKLKLYNPDARIIFLSNLKDAEIKVASLRTGAFEYITKDEGAFTRVFKSVLECVDDLERAIGIKTGSGNNIAF